MNVADRIQNLRKTKGISQEELADKIGVSRQTVSKWESEQSAPDMDKIILLSDYFEVTTDYLLKGIEAKENVVDQPDARIFSLAGTMFGFIGITVSIGIWMERQQIVAVMIGLILIAIGIMIHMVGQFSGRNAKTANRKFWTINVWFATLIPYSCIFNILQGHFGGFTGRISPIPALGNSILLYGIGWLIYIAGCATFDCIYLVKSKCLSS
ncbi:MAG: helix-turn-helix transcriptional regulator [Lachnospiraceae bacterium]|nr:helix-turn-helix transcriptional regulator [Lachnospiraceae bacterium]